MKKTHLEPEAMVRAGHLAGRTMTKIKNGEGGRVFRVPRQRGLARACVGSDRCGSMRERITEEDRQTHEILERDRVNAEDREVEGPRPHDERHRRMKGTKHRILTHFRRYEKLFIY